MFRTKSVASLKQVLNHGSPWHNGPPSPSIHQNAFHMHAWSPLARSLPGSPVASQPGSPTVMVSPKMQNVSSIGSGHVQLCRPDTPMPRSGLGLGLGTPSTVYRPSPTQSSMPILAETPSAANVITSPQSCFNPPLTGATLKSASPMLSAMKGSPKATYQEVHLKGSKKLHPHAHDGVASAPCTPHLMRTQKFDVSPGRRMSVNFDSCPVVIRDKHGLAEAFSNLSLGCNSTGANSTTNDGTLKTPKRSVRARKPTPYVLKESFISDGELDMALRGNEEYTGSNA